MLNAARTSSRITDVNRAYLEQGDLYVEVLGRGFAWLDTGTFESLIEASTFVHTLEERQGMKIACPEEVAYRMGFITADQVERLAARLQGTPYADYLLHMIRDADYINQ